MNTRLQTVALIIWWCEGTKPRRDNRWKNSFLYPIEVINSNPQIIKIFVDFLTSICSIPITQLHGQIQIHEGDNKQQIEKYWSKNTGIPQAQFNKTIIRKRGNKPGKNNGTFKVRLYNRKLFTTLENLLQLELQAIVNSHGD